MKKIAIIIEDIRLGGPQKQLIYYMQQSLLNNTNQNYKLLVPIGSKKKISKFVDLSKINIKEINITYLSYYSKLTYLINFLKDFKEIKKNLKNIDKVYIASGSSSIKSLLFCILLKKKIFFHIHDTNSNLIVKTFLFILSNFVRKFFFASNRSKKYYNFLSDQSKKVVLHSSVNINVFKRKIYHMNRSFFTVGFVANINPDKNCELLINIIKKIDDKKIKFKIIGNVFNSQKKYYEKNLNSFKDFTKNTRFFKNITDPKKIMKSFDLLICTSKNESLPLSIIEALSLSIPVISTDVGDISRILNENRCGLTVKSKAEEFIKVIKDLKENKKKIKLFSKNARKNAQKNFNIINYSKKLEREF